jgi:glycosyltransferase involved in cell wall biosynthesis
MPRVSVIIPCYNEEDTIQDLLTALLEQDFPVSEMEVIIADGMSEDETRARIRAFQKKNPQLRVVVVDNPQRTIPAGLNRALDQARGAYIVRMDAHTSPAQEYISRSITALEKGKGDNVGGVISLKPGRDDWVGRSIAAAVVHPLGVGDARYRIGSDPRAVDTVPFGAYRRSLVEEIGGYDEGLHANEDYEFNVRIRQSGRIVWLDPRIQSTYVARDSFAALAKQYWRYGFWKLRMLVRYPETFRWRQLSGAFVLTWIVLGFSSLWLPLARWLLGLEALIYGSALLIAGTQTALQKEERNMLLGVPLAIATMHFSWGAGFLWSLVTYPGAGGKDEFASDDGKRQEDI